MTIFDEIHRAAEVYKDQPCFQTLEILDPIAVEKKYLTYSEAWKAIVSHKSWLDEVLHHETESSQRDVVVAYLCSNSINFFLSMLACTDESILALPALLNTRWTASEMARSLQKATHTTSTAGVTSKTMFLYSPEFESTAQSVIGIINSSGIHQHDHSAFCLPLPTLTPILASDIPQPKNVKPTSPQKHGVQQQQNNHLSSSHSSMSDAHDALIVFTSGTTSGKPKGVRLSHRALLVQARAKLESPCAYSHETVMLASTVPFFHIGGLNSALAIILRGGCLSLPMIGDKTQASFDPNGVWRSLGSQQNSSIHKTASFVNTLVVVPAMLIAMLRSRLQHSISLQQTYPHVRLVLIGGQSLSSKTCFQFVKLFPNARFVQTYACTEAASSLTFHQIYPPQENLQAISSAPAGDCVGWPPAHVNIELMDPIKRKPILEMNRPGIITFSGPHVMSGYWKRGMPAEMTNNLKVATSDLGYWDAIGRLHFCGRANDTIRTGGETVFAPEVERVLLKHEQIVECAIFAKQDEKFGEAVACAIVCSPISLKQIKEWCARHGLASYKHPRYLFFLEELPKNSSGKVLKHKLVSTYGRPVTSKL